MFLSDFSITVSLTDTSFPAIHNNSKIFDFILYIIKDAEQYLEYDFQRADAVTIYEYIIDNNFFNFSNKEKKKFILDIRSINSSLINPSKVKIEIKKRWISLLHIATIHKMTKSIH